MADSPSTQLDLRHPHRYRQMILEIVERQGADAGYHIVARRRVYLLLPLRRNSDLQSNPNSHSGGIL